MSDELIRAVNRLMAPLWRRVRMSVSRGIISLVNDIGGRQTHQVRLLAGEEIAADAESFDHYGFTSVPHPGAEAVLITVGAERTHAVVVAVGDRRYRLRGLKGGEAALYDDLGQVVHLTRDGIRIETPFDATIKAARKLRLEADTIEIHATTLFRFDAAGHGQVWRDTALDTYQIGEVVTAHAIAPPEVPG
jgi:phage baseplate assembly protein V